MDDARDQIDAAPGTEPLVSLRGSHVAAALDECDQVLLFRHPGEGRGSPLATLPKFDISELFIKVKPANNEVSAVGRMERGWASVG